MPVNIRSPAGPLGGNVQPEEMLSFLNSANFSPYHSSSSADTALLGSDAKLAQTALTHESWMYGLEGHNRRLAFLGRRALKTYLTLLFYDILAHTSSANPMSEADAQYLQNILSSPQGIDQLLSTHRLGDHVGRALKLENVMRWHPIMRMDPTTRSQESGLFKVRGSCVEAVVGAIFHYRGAQVAQQFVYARILPNLEHLIKEAPASVQERITKARNDANDALAHSP
ncbi:hypothetical protein MVES1_001738 [Malassezia vespertilionis]|uniref:uncharacterized protein n=1 Tax=Malassezia vespertilionis TaxID=2020962 RepID=UPI0024B0D33E|nr:uncharacterized protein MVES1_001738 [Malassezia vespertilionis]WFD06393.1 hypothetical protein MVES1_001738 [Malassezia vespertilionis]